MGKSKKPNWGDAYDNHKAGSTSHHLHLEATLRYEAHWQSAELSMNDMALDQAQTEMRPSHLLEAEAFVDSDVWEAEEMMEKQEVSYYLDEAHEALSRLNQKTNKRNQNQKRPKREDNWY